MVTSEFAAMGGTVEVQIVDGAGAQAGGVAALFERHEQVLSRFRPDSELSALNDAGGLPFVASPTLFDAVQEAIGWACVTDGIFNPTVIGILEATGYDRPFDEIRAGVAIAERPQARTCRRRPWAYVDIHLERSAIQLLEGVRIDLGGIGKGFTVDRAIAELGRGANALVNASGDLYAAGAGPDGYGWHVGVQDPHSPDEDLAVLNVSDRGVATSGDGRRNWLSGDTRYHHLVDPRCGTASASGLAAVTVVALTATEADVLAKTAFLLGAREGLRFIERFPGADCLAVTTDGAVLTTSAMAEHYA